jgi:hypothetical protein
MGSNPRGYFEKGIPILLVLQSTMGLLQAFDSVGYKFYALVHRVMFPSRIDLGFSLVIPLLILLGIWVIWIISRGRFIILGIALAPLVFTSYFGLPGTISVITISASLIGVFLSQDFGGYLRWFFLLLGSLKALALVHWGFFILFGVASPLVSVADFERTIAYLTYSFSPYLVLTLMFLFLLRPIFGLFTVKFPELKAKVENPKGNTRFLYFLVFLSVLASLYPMLPTVNPRSGMIGVDIDEYVEAADLVEEDLSQIFRVSGGSRPLIYLIIQIFQGLMGFQTNSSILYLPLLLMPLLVMSVIFFTFEVFRDKEISEWAAFFTICGYPTVVGMHGYLLTNLLALSLVNLSLGFLFKSLRKGSSRSLILASIFGVLVVFTHPWTLNQYFSGVVVLLIFLVFWSREGKLLKETSWFVFLYFISVSAADVLKELLLRGAGSVSAYTAVSSNLTSMTLFWGDLTAAINFMFGGFYANILLLSLVICAVLFYEEQDVPSLYFVILLFLSSMVFLIGDDTIKSRILFNIPIGMFAAYGFIKLKQILENWSKLGTAFTFYSIISMLTFLFRSLANLI